MMSNDEFETQSLNTIRLSERHQAIIDVLAEGGVITGTQIAARLNVSIRTVYRDMRTIKRKHPNLASGSGAGYLLRNGKVQS